MKTLIAAIALTIAFPAAAQQSAQHQQHAQHQGGHQGMDHSQHQGMDHSKDGKGCCDMKCCDEAKKSGKKMKCCDKAGDHKGMKH